MMTCCLNPTEIALSQPHRDRHGGRALCLILHGMGRYRALRLGKRSRDGVSGEATTVFSFGYGEDDDKDGDSLDVTLGESNLIPALEQGTLHHHHHHHHHHHDQFGSVADSSM
jgi:hypothetical protein